MSLALSSATGSKRIRTDSVAGQNPFLKAGRDVTESICSFLDLPELVRMSTCDKGFKNYLPCHPRLWKLLKPKFGLTDAYWPECSQATAKTNFLLVLEMNRFAIEFFSRPSASFITSLRAIVCADMGMLQIAPFSLAENSRRSFVETTKPFVTTFLDKARAQFTDESPSLRNPFNRYLFFIDRPFPLSAMTDLFLLAGERGDGLTLQVLGTKADGGEFSVIERFADVGVLPDEYGEWEDAGHIPARMSEVSRERREAFFLKLINRGVRITNESLRSMINDGPIDLLRLLFQHAAEELTIPDDLFCRLFCVGLPRKFESWTAPDLCQAIDLLYRPGMVFEAEVSHDGFYECARLKNVELMEKIRKIGFQPNNERSPMNTIVRAAEKKLPWETIEFMILHGARASQETVAKFLSDASLDPALRLQILGAIADREAAEAFQ